MDRTKDSRGSVSRQWLAVVVVIVLLVVLSESSKVQGHQNPDGEVDYCGYVAPGLGTHRCPPEGTPIHKSPPTDANGNCRCYHAHYNEQTVTPTSTPTATTVPAQPGRHGGSEPDGQVGSAPTATATPTGTMTATRLPQPPSVPTAAPSAQPTPTEGVKPPTPEPTPAQRPWRSLCLIQHPGAPLNLCESGNGWRVYYFGHGGQVRTGPFVPRWGGIEDSIFFATVSPTTGKPVLAQWIADRRVVRIITYYDHYPHARHKTYAFDIMPDGTVIHKNW